MVGQSTIVYTEIGNDSQYSASTLAEAIVLASRQSLTAGQFDFALRPLTPSDIRRAVLDYPSGHERVSLDTNLVLLDTGAMLAYAPYRSTFLLLSDPFKEIDRIGEALELEADFARIRLHDALLTAGKLISLSHTAGVTIEFLRPGNLEQKAIPSVPIKPEGDAIMVVAGENDTMAQNVYSHLVSMFPEQEFTFFEPAQAFGKPWKAVLQIGLAKSTAPGARLGDAWAGGVPVIQFASPASIRAERRRRPERLHMVVAEHGKTGILCSTLDELRSALSDILVDILPARAVARSAKRRSDPANEWDILLKAMLQ
ncbi:MAG: hypothetical protein WDM89_18210 [Rhizomicrobium sp.]